MKYFGTDGFRGEANRSLTAAHAFKIGRYLGAHFVQLQKDLRASCGGGRNLPEWAEEKRPRIVIGKDTRRSGYMLENALAAGITTSGADVSLMHVTTTPSVSYAVRVDNFCCGIMISASHNPFYDNGIKVINSAGGKMEEALLQEVEDYMDAEEETLPLAERGDIGMVEDYSRGRNRYIGYLIQTVRRSFKRMRVGLDCANGASFTIAKNVFDALGAETHLIHDNPNGLNINLDCGSTHIESLIELVKKQKLDCGFAFDGDADRCIAVDNRGHVVNGDAILYICGNDMKAHNALPNDMVVTTIMSNFGLYKAFERAGIAYVKTPVGDKNVAAEMFEHGYALGGEQSGHIIFSKYATTGDGVLTALRLAEIIVENKTDLASLHQDLFDYPQVLRNILVDDKEGALANPRVQRAIEEANRILGNEGRTVVRASGTEPLIRVMVEHLKDDLCQKMADHIVQAFREEGYTE